MKDVALVSGSADYTAKIWKTNADGKVNDMTEILLENDPRIFTL